MKKMEEDEKDKRMNRLGNFYFVLPIFGCFIVTTTTAAKTECTSDTEFDFYPCP